MDLQLTDADYDIIVDKLLKKVYTTESRNEFFKIFDTVFLIEMKRN